MFISISKYTIFIIITRKIILSCIKRIIFFKNIITGGRIGVYAISILFRFDLLFIMVDNIDTENDSKIADHVIRMHRFVILQIVFIKGIVPIRISMLE